MESSGSRSDEVDLVYLLVRVFRFLVKSWLPIVSSILIFVTISWFSFKNTARTFETNMVVRSEFLSEAYAVQMVDNLQQLISDKNDSLLGAKLNLPPADMQFFESIGIEPLPSANPSLSELDKMVFLINVDVSQSSFLPRLQQGLVYFFENHEFLKSRVAERKKVYMDLIQRIDNEIGNVTDDSAGSLYVTKNPKSKDQKDKGTVVFDPSSMRVFMYKDRMDAAEKLSLLKGIEVVDGFLLAAHPTKPKLALYLTGGLTTGILVSLFIIGLKGLLRLNKKYPD